MKRTVLPLTLIALLMTIGSIFAHAQGTWVQHATFSFKHDTAVIATAVEFINNNTVIIGYHDAELNFAPDGGLYRWNFQTGHWRYKDTGSAVSDLAISRDTSYIMYAKYNGSVGSRLTSDLDWRNGFSTGFNTDSWLPNIAFSDTRYGQEYLVVGGTNSSGRAEYQIWRVAFSDDFDKICMYTSRSREKILNLETSKYVNEFFAADGDSNADRFSTNYSHEQAYGANHEGRRVTALAFNWETDADRLAVGNRLQRFGQARVRIYHYNGRHLRTLSLDSDHEVMGLDFSPTHWDILACVTNDRFVIWDINGNGTVIDEGGSDDIYTDVAFSPNGKYIAVVDGGLDDIVAKIWRNTGGLAAPSANPEPEKSPEVTTLLPNFPNPFNPETWIPYQLAKPAEVTVSIHGADGKLVRTLELGQLPAGVYQDKDRAAYWDGKNEQGESVASGVYFYTLKAGDFSATKKDVDTKVILDVFQSITGSILGKGMSEIRGISKKVY